MSWRPKALAGAVFLGWMVSAAAAEGPPPSRPMAGFLNYEFNKWLFFPCPAGRTAPAAKLAGMPFSDGTPSGTLFKAIQQRWQQSVDPLRGVYLEFSGYEEHDRVTATEFWRALGWVESCRNRPTNIAPGILMWAAGNEPSWNFAADAKGVRFRVPGETALEFPPAPARSVGRTLAWDGTNKTGRLRIEFTADLCSDTMSEAAFGRRVLVAVAGRLYTGCGFVR